MIQMKNVIKSFDGFQALSGLSLHVPKGAIYGLVGPNGAGKTTAIKHLTGVYRQDSGEVLIDGAPVFEDTSRKARVAYIPDDIYHFPQDSTRDMMRFYKDIYPQFDMDRYEKLGTLFAHDDKRPIRRLSRGMQKHAAFRLAMSLHPDVLVLDEPVDGLDPVMRRQVWSIVMGDVAEYGTTVLVSSHNLRELEDVCDHVGIMHEGKLLLERTLSDLQENITKLIVALPEGEVMPAELDILHASISGKLHTLIVRGNAEEAEQRLAACKPLFLDRVPLTLEEIFIYELGGVDYEVRDIIL